MSEQATKWKLKITEDFVYILEPKGVYGGNPVFHLIADKGRFFVEPEFQWQETLRNWRLMAAAPELLEACKAGLREIMTRTARKGDEVIINKLREAIANAEREVGE